MTEVSIDELAAARADGAVVVDVREPSEYVQGHVPGAVLVPLGEVPARYRELPTARRLYVVCASGNRSRRATDYLVGQGRDACSVQGGMAAWSGSGHPVVVGPRADVA